LANAKLEAPVEVVIGNPILFVTDLCRHQVASLQQIEGSQIDAHGAAATDLGNVEATGLRVGGKADHAIVLTGQADAEHRSPYGMLAAVGNPHLHSIARFEDVLRPAGAIQEFHAGNL